jgi:hypothetical protein
MDKGARSGLLCRAGQLFKAAALHRVQRAGKQAHQIDHRVGPRQRPHHALPIAQVRAGEFDLSGIALSANRPCLFRVARYDSQTRPRPQQRMGQMPPTKPPPPVTTTRASRRTSLIAASPKELCRFKMVRTAPRRNQGKRAKRGRSKKLFSFAKKISFLR